MRVERKQGQLTALKLSKRCRLYTSVEPQELPTQFYKHAEFYQSLFASHVYSNVVMISHYFIKVTLSSLNR